MTLKKMQFSWLTKAEQQALHQTLLNWGYLTRLELGGTLDYASANALHRFSQLGTRVTDGATLIRTHKLNYLRAIRSVHNGKTKGKKLHGRI